MPPGQPTPYLSTRDVADLLTSTTDYVVREVKLGRLPCERRIARRGGRTCYRFTREEVVAYVEAYDPALLPRVPRGTSATVTTTAATAKATTETRSHLIT